MLFNYDFTFFKKICFLNWNNMSYVDFSHKNKWPSLPSYGTYPEGPNRTDFIFPYWPPKWLYTSDFLQWGGFKRLSDYYDLYTGSLHFSTLGFSQLSGGLMSDLPFPRQNSWEQRWVSSRFSQLASEAKLLCPQAENSPAELPTPGHHIKTTLVEAGGQAKGRNLLISKRFG